MKECRDHTIEVVTAEWHGRHGFDPALVKERVTSVYKAELERVQREDKHRLAWVNRMFEAVVVRLEEAGLSLSTQVMLDEVNSLPILDLDGPVLADDSVSMESVPPPDETVMGVYGEWTTVKARRSRFRHSDHVERRKLIVWTEASLRVREFVSVAQRYVSLTKVCQFIRRKKRVASRIELIFMRPDEAVGLLREIRQVADFPWEVRLGRPYDIRKRDRVLRQGVEEGDGKRPQHLNPYDILQGVEERSLMENDSTPWRGRRRKRSWPRKKKDGKKKSEIRVGAVNIQGMAGKETEILSLLKDEALDVLVLSETWETGMQSYLCGITTHRYFVLEARKSQAKRGRNMGGCGMLVSNRLNARLLPGPEGDASVSGEQGSLMWVQVGAAARQPLFIGAVYGPQAKETKDNRESFYQRLKAECLSYQSLGKVLVLGDFNSRLNVTKTDSVHVGPFGEEKENANGAFFLSWLEMTNMFSLNGRRPDKGLYTRIRGKERSIIDYIVCDEELYHGHSGMRVLEEYDVGSDHKPIVATLDVKTIDRTTPVKQRKLKTWRLRDPEVAKSYRETLSRKLTERTGWSDLTGQERVEKEWGSLKGAILEAAEEVLGQTDGSQGGLRPWWNGKVLRAIRERRKTYRSLRHRPEADWEPYLEATRRVKAEVRQAKRESWEAFVAEIESTQSSDSKTFYRLAGRLDEGKRRAKSTGLDLETAASFFEHMGDSKLREGDHEAELPEGNLTTIERDQVIKALQSLSRGKAVSDDIATELLKDGEEALVDALHDFYQLLWSSELVPKDFVEGIIVPIHKQGPKDRPENYRGITLMNVVSKCYSKVTVNCISPTLESECIEEEQGGFRVNRACDEQFFALHTLLRSRKRRGKDTYLMFVDFKKAFDSVPRAKLMEKLLSVGVDGKVLRVIRSLYQDHSARMRVDGQTSRPFAIGVGVKQGCVMSTELFKVFVNDLIERLKAADVGVAVETETEGDALSVSCLMFADDLVMMAESQEDLQSLTNVLSDWCGENELEVNVSKTKVMVVGKANKAQVKLGDQRVEVVKVYKYLGLMLSRDLKWTEHVSYIVDKIKRRMAQCYRLLSNKDLAPSTRLHLYSSLILPVMSYGAGLWHLTDHQLRQLETLHIKALKAILGTCSTTTTAAVYTECGMISIEALQEEALLKLAGRIARMEPSRLVWQLFRVSEKDRNDEWFSQLTSALSRHDLALDGEEEAEAVKWNERVTAAVHTLFAHHLTGDLAKAVKCSQLRPCLVDGKLQRADYMSLPSKLASFCFKLRAGSLRLEIEEGRMKKLAREARLCPLCKGEVEDAEHFMLRCPELDHERHDLHQRLDETLSSLNRHYSELTHYFTEFLLGPGTLDGEDTSVSGKVRRVQIEGLHGMWVKRCTLLHTSSPNTIRQTIAALVPSRVYAHRVRQSCATNA